MYLSLYKKYPSGPIMITRSTQGASTAASRPFYNKLERQNRKSCVWRKLRVGRAAGPSSSFSSCKSQVWPTRPRENKERWRSGEDRTKGKGQVSGSKEEEAGLKFRVNRAKNHLEQGFRHEGHHDKHTAAGSSMFKHSAFSKLSHFRLSEQKEQVSWT